jgi:hypothetical protein
MGTLRSASDCSGLSVSGITLGDPTFTDAIPPLEADPLMFAWDDPRLPSGVIEDDGSVTLDETDDV